MPELKPNLFTSYDMTDKEELVGSTLSYLQQCYIHNLRSEAATSKNEVRIPDSAEDFIVYVKDEAYLRGKIEAYTELLEASLASSEITSTQN